VTGSGETCTMFGPQLQYIDVALEKAASECRHLTSLESDHRIDSIVPRVCREIFEAIEYRIRELNVNITAQLKYLVMKSEIC